MPKLNFSMILLALGCTGSPEPSTPAPTPIPSVVEGNISVEMTISNLSNYDLVFLSIETCLEGEPCELVEGGDGTFVVYPAGFSAMESTDLFGAYGADILVAALAVDDEADGYCWNGCEYVTFRTAPNVDIVIEFTDDDCCYTF